MGPLALAVALGAAPVASPPPYFLWGSPTHSVAASQHVIKGRVTQPEIAMFRITPAGQENLP